MIFFMNFYVAEKGLLTMSLSDHLRVPFFKQKLKISQKPRKLKQKQFLKLVN